VKHIEATQRIPAGCLRRLPFPVDEKEAKIFRYQGGWVGALLPGIA
jgi:hypothetical protein